MTLDLSDPVALTAQLVDIPSVSGDEHAIADAIYNSLYPYPHLTVQRDEDAIVASTNCGRDHRVIIAGHIDTVPIVNNVPSVREDRNGVDTLVGRGSVDMKGGVACAAHLAAQLKRPRHDVTWVFYDHEEVAFELSGLGRIIRNHPEWLHADMAILGEPTAGQIEGGCNGTLRVIVDFKGVAAHSARAWRGDNAIHKLGAAIERIRAFGNPTVEVDGLLYRESLSVVAISGGIANNVIPDLATLSINYRFAPSKSSQEALSLVEKILEGTGGSITIDDVGEGARPGLTSSVVKGFLNTLDGVSIGPKYGWTDVSQFSQLGVPALNFGPGDPMLAHTIDEHVPVEQIRQCASAIRRWLEFSNCKDEE